MNKYVLILVVISFAFLTQAHAEFYKYVDENGNVVFTDNIGNIPENQRSKVKALKEQQGASQNSSENDLHNQSNSAEEAQRQIIDTPKRENRTRNSCPAETEAQAAQSIKTTWTTMVQAMVSGNLEKALSFFSITSRDDMKRKMLSMSSEQIKRIFSNYKSITIESIYLEDGFANCGIIRAEENGEEYSYPSRFGRDADCMWRLRGL